MGSVDYETAQKDRRVLVAVDGSDNSQRAVLYVADILGGLPGFQLTVLHIVPEPPEDHFHSEADKEAWADEHEATARGVVENYRNILIQSGFDEEKVSVEVLVRYCPSVAECIVGEIERLQACTVVIGRRNISHKEEFLFGSTSSKLLRTARNCALWVVE